MGLYDGFKLDNSSYISQYVGSIVPELQNFSSVMQKRYEDAKDTDDALLEAMGNLQHLGTEEDTLYANELKQNYLNRLMDRSTREDYENLGRRTQRDARAFSSEYVPLANRLKGMQAIQQRIQQDDKIFAPETKNKILGYVQKMNSTAKNGKGEFERDASGKVKLGAIQDWAYAKDVDINKKLADFLKAKETDIQQSGFGANGRGLMVSTKRETRSAVEMAKLAKEMMETDPEIRAMIERDVTLNTYNVSPKQASNIANEANVSIYDRLKKNGLSENMIKSNLKAHGITMETAKLKPVDVLRQDYISKGRTAEEADMAYVKGQTRKQLMSPHIDLVANLLKVDRQTLEAREDPEFAARALGAAIGAAMAPLRSGEANPLIVTTDNGETQIDAVNTHNAAVEALKSSEEMKGNLQAAVGSYLGLPAPRGKATADWYNRTGQYINDKAKQGQLIQQLKTQGKLQEANNLTQAFNEYNRVNNKVVYSQQMLRSMGNTEDQMKGIYNEYKKGFPGAEKGTLSYESFKKSLIETPVKRHGDTYHEPGWNMWFGGGKDDNAMKFARSKYMNTLQKNAQEYGKTIQTRNTTFEPTSGGFLKNQTDFVENGLKEGTVRGVDMATGESFQDILRKEAGTSGWFRFGDNDRQISASDKSDPKSAYNQALSKMSARINMDTRGSNGEVTATVKLPSGQVRTIVLENISKNLPTEMAARMMDNAGKYMTRGEATSMMQNAAKGAGISEMSSLNQADLYQLKPAAQPYQINDMYYLKVGDAGIKNGSKTNTYTLMVSDGKKLVPTKVQNRTSIDDILIAIGGQRMREEMTVSPSATLFR